MSLGWHPPVATGPLPITSFVPPDAVEVEAPARLHLGVLDLRGALGRRFGGLGAAIPTPSLRLEARRAAGVSATGAEAERTAAFARRVLERWQLPGGVALHVHRAIPAHAGLGSGTALGLAVARAVAELYGRPWSPPELALASGRGLRSAIGTWAFALGGFILEGGRRPGVDAIAPMLVRHAMPRRWRYVLAIPEGRPGLTGEAEVQAFATLPPAPDDEVARVSHLVLMQLLPALVDADLPAFGAALTEVQRITGGWFAASQGGRFAPGRTEALVHAFAASGAHGVGQSSWGPAAYALVDGAEAAQSLANAIRPLLGPTGTVIHGAFAESGAHVRPIGTAVGQN
jgi:beta-RFAP synthase